MIFGDNDLIFPFENFEQSGDSKYFLIENIKKLEIYEMQHVNPSQCSAISYICLSRIMIKNLERC